MTFKEYLTSLGIEVATADKIVSGMPTNKFFLTSEENAETRLAKAKDQKDQLETDLANANKLVADLQKSVKDNEDASTKITQYQQEAEAAKTKQQEIEKTYAVKDALREAGATDVDYMIYKLGEVDLDKDGKVKDLDSKIKSLQESNPTWFPKNSEDQGADGKSGKGGYKPLDNGLPGGKEGTEEEAAQATFEAALGL